MISDDRQFKSTEDVEGHADVLLTSTETSGRQRSEFFTGPPNIERRGQVKGRIINGQSPLTVKILPYQGVWRYFHCKRAKRLMTLAPGDIDSSGLALWRRLVASIAIVASAVFLLWPDGSYGCLYSLPYPFRW